jgi:hypothetical protein
MGARRTAVIALVCATLAACSGGDADAGPTEVDGGPTATTEPVEVTSLDPFAGRDVELSGDVEDAVGVTAESVRDLGSGRALVAAFIPVCATIAEVDLERRVDQVLVADADCGVDTELVQVTVKVPDGYEFEGS